MDTEYEYPQMRPRNPMATAAITLGIISLMSCLFFYIAVPCGALAVLCALLSRGRSQMPGKSRAGLICGGCAIVMSLLLTLSSVWMMLTNPQMRAYLEYYMQYYLGDPSFDLDRELENAFPFLGTFLDGDASGAPLFENPAGTQDAPEGSGYQGEDAADQDRPRVNLNIADDDEDSAADDTPDETPDESPDAPSAPHSDEEGRFL